MKQDIRLTPTQAEAVQHLLVTDQSHPVALEGDRLRIPEGCESWVLTRIDEALAQMEANDPAFADGAGFSRYWAARRLRQAVGCLLNWRAGGDTLH